MSKNATSLFNKKLKKLKGNLPLMEVGVLGMAI